MSYHLRQQVRDGIVARLKDQLTLVPPEKVFNARPGQPALTEAPCINVLTPADQADLQERGRGRPQRRTVTVIVTAYVRDNDNAQPELDALCVEIERALCAVQPDGQPAWLAVHPALEDLLYASTQPLVVQGEAQNGVADLTLLASLYVKPGVPEAPIGARS